ncbi:MAG: hypothetical protein COW58_10125 [Thalassolituus sp. CG17_big_fil_post_rev_8_21_14_2_50_53_8]|nr:MAG: hypothetical protein COW58_10125 [Thalassolituus sp. CG17_big_fil_post_rev_8_21_14_2_50_53_8]
MRFIKVAILSLIAISAIAEEKYSWQWIKDEGFLSSFNMLIDRYNLPDWALDFRGPSELSYSTQIKEASYHVIHTCKPHNCANMNLTVLYSVQSIYILFNGAESYVIGNPEKVIEDRLVDLHSGYYKKSNVKQRLSKNN